MAYITVNNQEAASIPTPASGKTTLFIDTVDGFLKTKNSSGFIESILDSAKALVYKGSINCSTNPNYPAANPGHLYIVTVAGRIGGSSGQSVDVGDELICITKSSEGTQAEVGSNWSIIEGAIAATSAVSAEKTARETAITIETLRAEAAEELKLAKSSNLSDVSSVSSARINLGVLSATETKELVNSISATPNQALLTTDSRLKATIDKTGTTFCDTGWGELLTLAQETGFPINLFPGTILKFEKPWVLPHEVQIIVPGGDEGAVKFKFPTYKKSFACAGTGGTVSAGATEIVAEHTYGTFASSGTAFIENATGNFSGSFTYTSREVVGETTTFKGVQGFTGTVSTKNNIIQGCCIYLQQSGATSESFGPAITVEGPTAVSSSGRKETPPSEIPAGIVIGSGRRLNCRIKNMCYGAVFVGNHQRIGKEYATSSCWASLAWIGPSIQTGNQVIEATANCDAVWCSFFVAHNATIQAVDVGVQVHMGNTSFPIWREANPEIAGVSFKDAISGLHMDHPIFETIGSGIICCPDGKSSALNLTIRSPSLSLSSSTTPAERIPKALFEIQFEGDLVITEISAMVSSWFASYESCFLSDLIEEAHIDDFKSIVDTCRTKGIPLVKGKNTSTPSVTISSVRDGIRVKGGSNIDSEIKSGDVISTREGLGKLHRTENVVPVIGVALLDATQRVVTYATPTYNSLVKVNIRKRSTPPTSPSAEANATVGTLEARTYFAKIVHELSGGGLTAATAEVSATAEVNKSIKFKWTNAVEVPHGQTIAATRVYIGTSTGVESGYIKLTGTGTELIWSGAAKTGTTSPPSINTGCEIYGKGAVRANGVEEAGRACVSSGPNDNNGFRFGSTYETPDNGETAEVSVAVA